MSEPQHTPTAVNDTLIRIALVCMAQDPLWPLTTGQQEYLQTRLATRAPLTAQERTRLKSPLLTWAMARLGTDAYARLERQFSDTESLG